MTAADVDSVWHDRLVKADPWQTILLVAVVVAFIDTAGQWAVATSVGLWLQPIGFVIVVTAILVGWPARWGNTLGLLVAGAVFGDWPGGVARAVAVLVATIVAGRLWARRHGTRDANVGWRAWGVRYGTTAIGAVLAFAATEAWLLDVVGRASFGTTILQTVRATLPLALVGAPVGRIAGERIADAGLRRSTEPVSRRARTIVVTTVLLWVVVGYVSAFLFRAADLVPRGELGRRLSPAVELVVTLGGPQGSYVQVLLGVTALAVVAVVIRQD